MIKKRIIPVMTYNGMSLIKTKQFDKPRMVGNPIQAARVYNARNVDELAFIDIYATKQNRKINIELVKLILNECFMPVSVGGGISTLSDIRDLLHAGADKVIIKNSAIYHPEFIEEAVLTFGSQCIVIAVDAIFDGKRYKIYNSQGLDITLEEFVVKMHKLNVGEFLITSVNHEGMMNGFDINLARIMYNLTDKPNIIHGGAGNPQNFLELFNQVNISAAAAASIFHFTQYTPKDIKDLLKQNNIPVRNV